MKLLFATLIASAALFGAAACASNENQYDGVSRFAGSEPNFAYYGPGSPPRDS